MNDKIRQQIVNLQNKGYQQVWFNGRDIVRITDTGKLQKLVQNSFVKESPKIEQPKKIPQSSNEWGEF